MEKGWKHLSGLVKTRMKEKISTPMLAPRAERRDFISLTFEAPSFLHPIIKARQRKSWTLSSPAHGPSSLQTAWSTDTKVGKFEAEPACPTGLLQTRNEPHPNQRVA